jgi:hypothetical protein
MTTHRRVFVTGASTGLGRGLALHSSAVESQQRTSTFPWQMRWIGRVMAHAPESVLRRFAPPPRTS